jgi:lysophospholipase L1-like esterase
MKNILILGDSYSTYEHYIPEGYAFYYCSQGREQGPAVTKMKLEETWWQQVVKGIDGNLLLNNSWSGSTIGYTGYDKVDCSKINSFIYRFRQLKEEGFFQKNQVDTVFVFGGTNDSWSDAPLGEMKLSNWEEKDLYFVLPAICHLMKALKDELPNAEIYFLINTELKPEIEECVEKAGEYYGVQTIRLQNIEKECGHPNPTGMNAIAEQVLAKVL